MNSDFDLIPRSRGRGRTSVPSPTAPSSQPVIGLMPNGMWRPGELTEARQVLRRPMSSGANINAEGPPSILPVEQLPSKHPHPSPYASPPQSPPFVQSAATRQTSSPREPVEPPSPDARSPSDHVLPAVHSPWMQSRLETEALPKPAKPFPADAYVAAAGDVPLSTATKPFSPSPNAGGRPPGNSSPLSTDAKPFSPTRGNAGGFGSQSTSVDQLAAAVDTRLSMDARLSADAKEFVPRRRAQPGLVEYDSPADYEAAWAGEEAAGCPDDFDADFGIDVTPEEVAMNHLTEVVAHLTVNPALFDKMVPPLLEAFRSWFDDEETVRAVVGAIFESSVTDSNFRFNGARLCHKLHNEFGSRFRTYMLNTCRREHELACGSARADPARARGYLLFVADLYVTLELVRGSGQRIDILRRALAEAAATLLGSPAAGDDVKCVCQALKLAGYQLDLAGREDVDSLFARLREIRTDPQTGARTQLVIHNVVGLREDNWGVSGGGRAGAAAPPTTPPAAAQAAATPPIGPVYYGTDGHILSTEERRFLQDSAASSSSQGPDQRERGEVVWEPDDEMDDEIQAAFEQFLLLGRQQLP